MAYGPSVLLHYARTYGRRFFLQFGLHCATHQIRIILVSCVVITSLFYPALALYSSSQFISILDVTRSQYPQDLENLWAGCDSLRVLEDPVSRGKIHSHCGVDGTLRVEQILIQSSFGGAVNHQILQSTLEFERRIDQLQLPCLKRLDGTCFVLSPLAFWHHNQAELLADPTILDTLLNRNTSIAGIPITPQMVLAGRGFDEPHASGTKFDYATFLALTYFFPNSDCVGRAEHLAWLSAIDAASLGAPQSGQTQEPTFIALEYDESRPHRTQWTAISALLYLAYTGFCVYVTWSMRRIDAVHSRVGIIFTALVEIAVSTITSVSVCALVGFKVTMVPWELLPIVIVFVGAENMFNLVDAVTKTSVTLSVKQRIAQGLSHAGTSNTLKVVSYNSILGVIAVFATGAIRQFCVFAIVVLVAHWFLAHTFFLAVLSIDIQRLELDDLLRQNASLAPAVPSAATEEVGSKKPRTPWEKLAIKAQTLLRGRAMKNISLVMLLAITATLYYTTYPTETGVLIEEVPQRAVTRNLSSNFPHHQSQPAWKIWKTLNPHETKLYLRVEAPTILTFSNSHRTNTNNSSHRSKLLSVRTLRFLFWVVKIVVLPITVTTTALWGLLLYLLKDADLLEAQRNRPDVDSPEAKEEEDGSALEGHISFSTLPRAFTCDVELIATSDDGGIVVSVGMQNEVIIWRMPSRVHVAIDVTDLLMRSASTSRASSTLTCVAVDAGGDYCAVGTGAGNIAFWTIGKDSIHAFPLLSLGNSCAGVVDLHFLSTTPRGLRPTPPQSEPSSPTDRQLPVSLIATYESGLAAKWDVGINVGVAYFTPSPRASLVKALLLRVPQTDGVLVGFCMDDGTFELAEVQSSRALVLPDYSLCAGNPEDVVTRAHACLVDVGGNTRLVVAAVTESGIVSLWDSSTGELIHRLDETHERINHLRISPAPSGPCHSCGKLPFDGFFLAFSVDNIVHFFRIYMTDQARRCSCNVHPPRKVPSWDSLGRRSRTSNIASSPGGSPAIPRAKLSSVFEPAAPFPISGHGVHSRRASEKDSGRRSLEMPSLPGVNDDQDLLKPLEFMSTRASSGLTSLWQHIYAVRVADTVCDRGGWDIYDRRVVGVRRKPRTTVKNGSVKPNHLVAQSGLTPAMLERWELWSFDPSRTRIQSSALATLVGDIDAPAQSRSSTSSASSTDSSRSRIAKDTIPRLPFTRASPFTMAKSHAFAGFGNTVGLFNLMSS
ncbi:sterol regulatory element binding protein cleavage-activating protein [Mycena sanguinolenta]|nr:sterol regulatory element binding protein cleavage-activating protein [Mycena sanguinolenta]